MMLCSFDIENMYTNIPKTEIANILNNIIENHGIDKSTQKEIMQILGIVLEKKLLSN
jgi:hypothetical protein